MLSSTHLTYLLCDIFPKNNIYREMGSFLPILTPILGQNRDKDPIFKFNVILDILLASPSLFLPLHIKTYHFCCDLAAKSCIT